METYYAGAMTETKRKSLFIAIGVIVLLLLIAGGAWWWMNRDTAEEGIDYTQEYDAIENREALRSEFPRFLLLGSAPRILHSDGDRLNGRFYEEVTYTSTMAPETLANEYKEFFPAMGWIVRDNLDASDVYVISATRGGETVTVSIEPNEGASKVRVSYLKNG